MQIYLPIAEMSINIFLPIFLGLGGGFLAGLFGVGGGFILTPLLIFSGIPPTVAVGTQSSQMVASSASGFLAYFKNKRVDFKMGNALMAGGFIGSLIGVLIFSLLSRLGQIDLVINLSYVVLLGGIGIYMLIESINAVRGKGSSRIGRGSLRKYAWIRGLPYKQRFPASKMYISVLVPAGLGALIGVMVSIMGISGGFLMVPAMIYMLGIPTNMVAGTNLYQITILTAFVTIIHSVQNENVDILLAFILLTGGTIGAQIGSRLSTRVKSEHLRIALGLIVLLLCIRMSFTLTIAPESIYEVVIR